MSGAEGSFIKRFPESCVQTVVDALAGFTGKIRIIELRKHPVRGNGEGNVGIGKGLLFGFPKSMGHIFADCRIISEVFTGIAADLPAVITAVGIGAVTGHGPEVMKGPYNRTYPGQIGDILNSQKTVMWIMKMDQVNLVLLQKMQNVLSTVADM